MANFAEDYFGKIHHQFGIPYNYSSIPKLTTSKFSPKDNLWNYFGTQPSSEEVIRKPFQQLFWNST